METDKKNTVFNFMYRDASNYKLFSSAVAEGLMTEEDYQEILGCLYDDEYFIPEVVGLEGERFSNETDDDHPWFEVTRYEHTSAPCDCGMTVKDLVENFKKAKGHWLSDDYQLPGEPSKAERQGRWILTDDSCCQYCRMLSDDVYEFYQMTAVSPNHEYGVSHSRVNVTEVDPKIIHDYGYSSLDKLKDLYGGTWKQILAEMEFETYAGEHIITDKAISYDEAWRLILPFVKDIADEDINLIQALDAYGRSKGWSRDTIIDALVNLGIRKSKIKVFLMSD